MSLFTESGLVKKLLELNPSQQSIQTLSLWLIHHRKHFVTIVKTWIAELHKVSQTKKLTFMYLANDVIQNSKKKGPEYGKEFENFLTKAFDHIAKTCTDEKTRNSLDRILKIWEERGVYDANAIKEYHKALHSNDGNITTNNGNSHSSSGNKRKSEDTHSTSSSNHHSNNKDSSSSSSRNSNHMSKKHRSSSSTVSEKEKRTKDKPREHVKSEVIEVNGTVETHVTLSPHASSGGEPPEPEELIKMILYLESSASSDATIREKIAHLPPEVSETSILNELEDKETAIKLAHKVNDAVKILNDYNARLATEMNDRKKLSTMLKDFQREQQELSKQAEQRLEEYNKKLQKMKELQKEVRSHMLNLPDLTQLPDVGGLAPLPSAGDLFNLQNN